MQIYDLIGKAEPTLFGRDWMDCRIIGKIYCCLLCPFSSSDPENIVYYCFFVELGKNRPFICFGGLVFEYNIGSSFK